MSAPSSELDTVESALRGHPDVVEVATFRTATQAPARRVAAVVPGLYGNPVDIRDHLWSVLSGEHLPDVLLMVPELPRTRDGAVDTGQIERESLNQPGSFTFRAPTTLTEVEVATVWGEVLGRQRVSADDNFLDLGGDSMTAALLLDLMNERLCLDLGLDVLLAAPSLGALAETIGKARQEA